MDSKSAALIKIGDVNRHCGLPSSDDKVTYGGELIRSFLQSDIYVLVNSSSILR